ncbi:MAG: DUF72 domain-containing protein [bacterium]
MLEIDSSRAPANLLLGTSSFSSADWRGAFYPEGTKPADFLTHYAAQLRTVEIDATWHAMPARRTFEEWARKTPNAFVFALKVPKTITHEKYLEGCEDEWARFLDASDALGAKRGPLIFQFPYVAKGKDAEEYATGRDFVRRLEAFLPLVPREVAAAVEVRNEKWLTKPLLDCLRAHAVALVLVDYYTMPAPARLFAPSAPDPVTAPFCVVRFLGHHRDMDALVARLRAEKGKTREWDELVVDRSRETRAWIPAIQRLLERNLKVFAYFNNHYAGFAPGSIDLFLRLWREEIR